MSCACIGRTRRRRSGRSWLIAYGMTAPVAIRVPLPAQAEEPAQREVGVGERRGRAERVHADGDARREAGDRAARDAELHADARLGGEADVDRARAAAPAGSIDEQFAADEEAQEERVPAPEAEQHAQPRLKAKAPGGDAGRALSHERPAVERDLRREPEARAKP